VAEGTSAASVGSPFSATDADGSQARRREQRNLSSAQRESERTSSVADQNNQVRGSSGNLRKELLKALLTIKKVFYKFFGIVLNCDVLHIIRPLVYVCLVMKHGRKSWIPIQVSFAMDLLIIFLVFLKLIGSEKLRTIERRDLTRRNYMSLLKYLIRDPIFDQFTLKVLQRIFAFFRIPQVLYGIVLSILNYYRYYTYIA